MATVAELNQLISITDQAINELRERIAQRERSLANVSDKFQANAAYRARLQAEIVQLKVELAAQQTALSTAVTLRNQAQQTAKKKVSPKVDPEANQAVRIADGSQLPPYDDNGNLNPGWAINDENGQPYYTGNTVTAPSATPVNTNQNGEGFGNVFPDGFGGFVNGDGQPVDANGSLIPTGNNVTQSAALVDPLSTGYISDAEQIATAAADAGGATDLSLGAAGAAQVGRNQAQAQSVRNARQQPPKSADWRVRIQLAPNADYLYKEPASRNGRESGPGILAPLAKTDGVVFPYTPTIETAYVAKYNAIDLTHSNYKGYFYQGSSVNDITIKGTFTAQDTAEAAYLLAVIHFFRSVTKMFYGQDPQRGTPPPLVYLSGFGDYQFSDHPCMVANFTYSLPADVDYIRAVGFNNYGVNMDNRRNQVSGPGLGGILGSFIKQKLGNNGLSPGGVSRVPSPPQVNQNVNNTINSTYVPTKMEISVTLHPVQTRNQVSKQFSLQGFANGQLLKGGFW